MKEKAMGQLVDVKEKKGSKITTNKKGQQRQAWKKAKKERRKIGDKKKTHGEKRTVV